MIYSLLRHTRRYRFLEPWYTLFLDKQLTHQVLTAHVWKSCYFLACFDRDLVQVRLIHCPGFALVVQFSCNDLSQSRHDLSALFHELAK